jgi:amino-acid N-acetyltransferase
MNPTADLTGPLMREVARLYVRAQRTQIACCDAASNVQCHVLTELLRNDVMTQRGLVERLSLDKGWISRAVDALVEESAVTKQQSEVDRRSVKLSLTTSGLGRAQKLEQQLNSHAAQLLAAIPVNRHAQVQETLQLLLQALQNDGQKLGQDEPCGAPDRETLVVRSAIAGDWEIIADLLREAALPLDGAREHLDHFVVGTINGQIVCAGGLEIYGSDALLRSVVVAERFRGMKYGLALMVKIMQLANERGVVRLFLLTTTAASYFGTLGFVPASRDEVPEAVKQSREFQGACPASATLLTALTNI